jgi:hypothetical protein
MRFTGRCDHARGMTRVTLALLRRRRWRDAQVSLLVGMIHVWNLMKHRMPWLGVSLVLVPVRAWW